MRKAFVYSGILSFQCFVYSWLSQSPISNLLFFALAISFGILTAISLIVDETDTNN